MVKARTLSGAERAALPPQLRHRGDRGPPARGPRGRAQRRPAPELTPLGIRNGPGGRRSGRHAGAAGGARRRSVPLPAQPRRDRADPGPGALRGDGERPVGGAWTWTRPTTPRSSSASRCAAACRRARPRSRWPRSTRRPGSATWTTATATRSGCSSSGRPRAGAPCGSSATRTTRRASSTTPWSRSTAGRAATSTTSPSGCSAAATPRRTGTTRSDARVLASTLTGHSPGGFRCLDRSNTPGDPEGLASSLRKTFGKVSPQTVDVDGRGRRPHHPAGLGVRALRGGQRQVLRRDHGQDRRPDVADG